MFNDFKNKARQFMVGRYGVDHFARRTMTLSLIAFVFSLILRYRENSFNVIFSFIAMGLLIFTYYRIFSKEVYKMQAMNRAYIEFEKKIFSPFIRFKRNIFGSKDHIYCTCPECKKDLKLPRNKGKLKVTCPHCKYVFYKRT